MTTSGIRIRVNEVEMLRFNQPSQRKVKRKLEDALTNGEPWICGVILQCQPPDWALPLQISRIFQRLQPSLNLWENYIYLPMKKPESPMQTIRKTSKQKSRLWIVLCPEYEMQKTLNSIRNVEKYSEFSTPGAPLPHIRVYIWFHKALNTP